MWRDLQKVFESNSHRIRLNLKNKQKGNSISLRASYITAGMNNIWKGWEWNVIDCRIAIVYEMI